MKNCELTWSAYLLFLILRQAGHHESESLPPPYLSYYLHFVLVSFLLSSILKTLRALYRLRCLAVKGL